MTSITVSGTEKTEKQAEAAAGKTRAEFRSLVSACGIYDLSARAKIAVTGGDRVRWLNGMVSNNIRDLAQGHGVYAFLLNAQGRIQADLYAFQRGDSLLIDAEGTQKEKILQLFDRYIIADDVEIAAVSDKLTAIGLTGPESLSVLAQAEIVVPPLAHLQFTATTWQQKQIIVLHAGQEVRESWQVWTTPADRAALLEALVKAGAQPVGGDALNLFRISRGVPQVGVDIRDRDLPQETGQSRALNFTKGCYLGQEIVERIRSRGAVHRQFSAFEVEGPLPEPGAKVLAGDKDAEKEVGEITSSAILFFGDEDHDGTHKDRPVALGYLRREAAGKELRAGSTKLKQATLPLA
jgi:folate-binding protein YgfZ